ncbi:MAG: T9SS type A sorting domain-containing protein [Bacteroidota bacterium]
MKSRCYHSIYVLLLIFLFGLSTVISAQAQKVTETYQQQLQELEQTLPEQTRNGKITYPSDDYLGLEYDQEWISSDQPDPQNNINLPSPGNYAGDVNGDGNDDYVRVDYAMDDRTSDLSDTVYKTGVFYGTSDASTPDQLLYHELKPVGDVNGDSYADALRADNTGLYLVPGSSDGYDTSAETQISSAITDLDIVTGFMDLNGDNLADFAIHPGSGDTLFYVMGNSSVSSMTVVSYTTNFSLPYGSAIVFDDAGQNLHLVSHNDGISTWLQISTDGDKTNDISVQEEIATSDRINNPIIRALVVDNSTQIDYLVQPNNAHDTYHVTHSQDGSTKTRTDLGTINFAKAGDLNQDGEDDYFYLNDSDMLYISFGDGDLSNSFTEDVQVMDLSSDDIGVNWVPQAFDIQPDYNGDGNGDFWLETIRYDQNVDQRNFYALDGSNNLNNPITIDYPDNVYANTIDFTENLGDINGDGIEDVGFVDGGRQTIEIYYGGSPVSSEPDMSLDLSVGALQTSTGDINGDGYTDLVVNDNSGRAFEVFYGSESGFNSTADQSIKAEDTNTNISDPGLYFATVVGDVNGDGNDDIVGLSTFGRNETNNGTEYANEAYVYLGGSSVSASPDQTISVGSTTNSLSLYGVEGNGDLNGDGYDDFVIQAWNAHSGNTNSYDNTVGFSSGAVFVYHGNSNGTFGGEDLLISPPADGQGYITFGQDVEITDLQGNGSDDLLIGSYYIYNLNDNYTQGQINTYLGGSDMDGTSDGITELPINSSFGRMQAIHDIDGDQGSEIWYEMYDNGYRNRIAKYDTDDRDLFTIIKVDNPNTNTRLLGYWDQSNIGQYTGTQTYSMIASNVGDDNDHYYSSRVYRFDIPAAVQLTSVDDVADDQGGWVTVTIDGALVDGQFNDSKTFDEWSVWRETSNGWTNVASVPYYSDGAKFVDVRVPQTRPSDAASDSDEGKFNFRVTLHDDGELVAESNVKMGFALDNKSPAKVTGLAKSDTDKGVQLSWDASQAPDLGQYEVYLLDDDGSLPDSPVKTTSDTKVTFNKASSERNFAVKATDVNGNEGKASDPITVTSVEEGQSGTPATFALQKNYPNPFNPTTKIDYALPQSAEVTITVYNALGQTVATLVDGQKSAGYHSVSFDAQSMNSGVYIYRIEAGNFSQTRKMMLVK